MLFRSNWERAATSLGVGIIISVDYETDPVSDWIMVLTSAPIMNRLVWLRARDVTINNISVISP